jgi:phosphoglycolate phosphatase-like HAD superfamily hydrolase|nr:MAG TPA: tail tape measure protein [Caudoviricetes sp.]
MELFKLFGTIAVKNSQANEAIDETTGKAAQSESKMSSAFKKIGSAFTKAFSNNGKVKETSQSLKQLTETVDKQESVLTQLKNKYRDLYLTHGKNSTEAKECAKEIDRLSSELKENKTKLTEAERAADKFDKTLDDVSDSSNDASNSMSDSFKKIGAAVTAYFAVDKVVNFGKQVVEAAANVSAEASAFEQIMGGYSDTAQKKMNEIADNTGMVASRLTPYMTSMTAKFKGLGFDIGEATDLASDGLNLAADAAAFWDMSLDNSMSHLNSFVNGSYEGGEAIGLFANDTQMASYAVSQGLVKQTKDWASLDEATKQATRLEYAQNMMKASGAVGQAAKESSQYANVQANLNEKWRQFKAQIGEPLLENVVNPAMQKLSGLVDKASTGFQDLQKWVSENKTLLSVLGGVIGAVAVGMTAYSIAQTAMTVASKLHTAATVAEKLAVLDLNGAMLTSPVTWIVAGIVALIAVFVILWNKCEGFRNFWINLWDKIKTAFAPVIEFVKSSFESFKEKLQTGIVPALQDLWAAIKEKVLPVLSLIWDYVQIYIQPAFEWLKTGLGNIKIVFQTIFTVIKTIVSTAFENIKTIITTVWNNIKIVISTVLDVIKNIIKLATSIIKGDWKGAWEAIKGIFSSIWNGIKGIVSNVWNAIKSIFSNNLNAIKSSVSTVFNGVKAVIQNTINGAKNIVKSGLDAIKNFFSKLKLKFPSIKLPHFSIKGSFSLKPPSVPKLSVDWYAKAMKNAMLLNQPTIFGVNPNGNLMGGGEAGQEVVAGSSTLMAMIRNAVQNENAGIIYYLDKLISMLTQYFPEILGNLEREMVLDDGTLVAKITPKVDKKLGDINRMKERGQ